MTENKFTIGSEVRNDFAQDSLDGKAERSWVSVDAVRSCLMVLSLQTYFGKYSWYFQVDIMTYAKHDCSFHDCSTTLVIFDPVIQNYNRVTTHHVYV